MNGFSLPTADTIQAFAPTLTDVTSEQEEAIVNRLSPLKRLGFAVVPIPDKIADLSRSMPRGCITVRWDRAIPQPPNRTDIIVQDELQIFSISVMSAALRSSNSAQLLKRLVLMYLRGFRLPHSSSRAFIYGDKFAGIERKSKLWEYVVELAVPTIGVQADELDPEQFLIKLTILDRDKQLFLEIEEESNG